MSSRDKTVMEVAACKENGSATRESENKLIQCASNKENTLDMEPLLDDQATIQNGKENVDIIDCANYNDKGLVDTECQDETESSSSFGDSLSMAENDSMFSEAEVESRSPGGNGSPFGFEGRNAAFHIRKKRLTDHWNKFRCPIMWRCKWLELRMKECQSQAVKYDRKLAEYDHKKQYFFEKHKLEGFDAKLIPFSTQIQKKNVAKRKKRRRVEETTDKASYMSNHNVFSYYENKGPDPEAFNDEFSKLEKTTKANDNEFNDEWVSFEFRDYDYASEQMLSKIVDVQLHVRKLKNQIDKVLSDYPGKFISINNLGMHVTCDSSTSSEQNCASPPEDGDKMPDKSVDISSPHISEFKPLMSQSAVPSHGDSNPLSDMIDDSGEQQAWGSCEHVVKEELLDVETGKSNLLVKPDVKMEDHSTISPVTVPEAELVTRSSIRHVHFHDKSDSASGPNMPRNKRRQGRRKAGSSRWSRRSSG